MSQTSTGPLRNSWLLYIIFIKFFLLIIPTFRFCSRRYFTSYWLFFHMLHFPHLYLFLVSSVFLMFPTFTCAPIHPSTCFHFSFHVLWLCSRPFLSYYDTLYFYVLSSLRSRLIPTQYINRCIFLVVLEFVNWRWFSSSPIFSSILSKLSLLSRRSPHPLVTIYLLRRTSDPPILRPDLRLDLWPNSRTPV